MLPPALETPLQLIKCSCSMSVCETSRCKYKVNHLYCTDLCCRGAEEDSCKILPVVNMLGQNRTIMSLVDSVCK